MASFTLARTDTDGNIMTYTSANMVSMNIDNNTPVPPMPLPIQKSTETLLIKVDGNITTVTVNWKIRDLPSGSTTYTGNEPAGYTGNAANLVGALQVIDYWKNWFVPVTPDESYVLTLGGSMTFKGNMVSSSFTVNQANPAVWEGNFRFVEGNVAGATHAELAELTHGSIQTTSVNNRIQINNVQTTYLGTSSGITGYLVKYREKGTTSWTEPTVSYQSGSSHTGSQYIRFYVADSGTYEVKISPKVSTGIIQQESSLMEIVES